MTIRNRIAVAAAAAVVTLGLPAMVASPTQAAVWHAPAAPKPGVSLLTPPKFDPKTSKLVPVEDLNGKKNARGQLIQPPAALTLTSGFKYSGQYRSQTGMIGAQTTNWIDKPSLDTIDSHSLAETSLEGGTGNRNVIELGWVTNNDGLFAANNLNPHLFASAWYDNGSTSVWCGSYLGGCGYTDYAPNPIDAGADLIGVRFTSKLFYIQYEPNAARWWLWYDTDWIGSFPANLTHGATFTTANFVQNFGEVAYRHYPTCTDMGAGWMAVAGGTAPTSGAIFTALKTATAAVPTWTTVDYTGNTQTDPTKYGLVDTGTGGFKYGGPGSSPNPGACPTP